MVTPELPPRDWGGNASKPALIATFFVRRWCCRRRRPEPRQRVTSAPPSKITRAGPANTFSYHAPWTLRARYSTSGEIRGDIAVLHYYTPAWRPTTSRYPTLIPTFKCCIASPISRQTSPLGVPPTCAKWWWHRSGSSAPTIDVSWDGGGGDLLPCPVFKVSRLALLPHSAEHSCPPPSPPSRLREEQGGGGGGGGGVSN